MEKLSNRIGLHRSMKKLWLIAKLTLMILLFSLANANASDGLRNDSFGDDTPASARETYNAQQREVTGTVTSVSGQPLPGVTVVVKGTTKGTVTDSDGEYTLTSIPENATLTFSFVGMKTQDVVVGNQTTIDVTMEEETIGLDEVVAVGYGTLQRNRVSTSITTIEPEKVKMQVTSSIDQSLEGQVAGLSIRQTTGAPGRWF